MKALEEKNIMEFEVNIPKLNKIFKQLASIKIAIIGDLMIDRYFHGTMDRISPEAPVPILSLTKTVRKLGGAANVTNIIRGLGSQPYLIGIIGKDSEGSQLKNLLRKNSISTEFLIESETRMTTEKTRLIAQNQQIIRFDNEITSFVDENLESKIISKFSEIITEVDGVIIQDYNKGMLSEKIIDSIISLCQKNSKFVAVDPKKLNFHNYKKVNLFKPNLKELQQYTNGSLDSEGKIVLAGKKLINELQPECLIVTLGSKGLIVFNENKVISIPTFTEEVFDPTGAGDTMISILSLMRIIGNPYEFAAIVANHAAGVICRKFGTSIVSTDEIIQAFKFEKKPHFKQIRYL